MTDHDPFDDELRSRLSATDGAHPDARARLDELRPRFRAARRRRQQRIAAVTSAAAVVLLVVGVTVLGGSDDQTVGVADGSGRSTTTTTTTFVPTSTSAPAVATTVAPAPTTTAPAGSGSATTTTSVPRPTGGTTVPGGPVATSPTVPTATVPAGGTQVLQAEGGTATVVWTPTSIRVESTAPAAGWELESTEQKSTTRVEVRFHRPGGGSGSSGSTIDARVIDGRLVADT